MELIKEIANEKLVIMVTHNPELAYKYSTRIVKFLDGEVIDDSNPFSEEDEAAEVKENSGMPGPIVKYVNKNLKETAEKEKTKAITEVSKSAAQLIVMIGCIIIIYIIAKILLRIITVVFDIFTKLPVIKQFNEIGGLLYGIIEAFFLVVVAFTLISVITPLVGNYAVTGMIEQSYIGKLFYNTNIILNIIF